ncbi:MAG: glycosyltransferase family 4 protein [Candidatus Brocadiia bacterium]
MRTILYDHAGHPFQVQLSRELARRGHTVFHGYTAGVTTPRGKLLPQDDDPETFSVEGISIGDSFSRYSLLKRFFNERALGKGIVERVEAFRPDVVVSANTPLETQRILQKSCRKQDVGFVFWVQDLLSVGIESALRQKIPFVGGLIGKYFQHLEYSLLRRSDRVVVITEDFCPIMDEAGVETDRVHVVQNWAPLEDMPVRPKQNEWSRERGLDDKFCFVYSGTLGMKHNPDHLVRLASEFEGADDVRVDVVSEGLGADYLRDKKEEFDLKNLILSRFQPFEDLPDVLGTADVVMGVLEPEAGVFSVPSKVLTYLCTGRPILLAMPPENLTSRIVSENEAGLVVPPDDSEGFVDAARRLYDDGELRKEMGENARDYAETHFDIRKIGARFERIVEEAAGAALDGG